MTDNPAVEVAKERRADDEAGVVTLSTGVRARLRPVSASLIDEVRARVPVPKVPLWHNPDTDRDEENPNDPAYTRALEEHGRKRGQVTIDAMVMFGCELVDPVPDVSKWAPKLRCLGIEVDEHDEVGVEFAYKKYIAVAPPDLDAIGEKARLSKAAVEGAAAGF